MSGYFRTDRFLAALIFTSLVLLGLLAILWINRGTLTYTLDDTYIHLAVAEELATHGHYGVNSSEVSAPCSSPAWPFLMAPFTLLPIAEWSPLVIGWLAGLATVLIIHQRLARLFPGDGAETRCVRLGLVMFFVFGTNLLGLVFTGMEHGVQVLLAVLVVEGMLRMAEGNPSGRWFPIAVVVGPWIRYENLALTAAAMLFLLLRRKILLAATLGVVSLAGLAAFSAYLVSLGLDPVPVSISAKSTFAGQNPLLAAAMNLKNSLTLGRGVCVALPTSLLIGLAFARRDTGAWKAAALAIAAAGCLHLVAGAYGWVNRYEIYILASLLFGLLGICGITFKSSMPKVEPRHLWLAAALLPVVGFPYLSGIAQLPIAANNIYEQHYQMHRFVSEFWKKPIAVNDLGYVSFRNPDHVLDLWGLASSDALRFRTTRKDPDWMRAMAEEKHVELAILYEPWFPQLPQSWKKVAAMSLSRKCVVPAWHEVSFYSLNSETQPELIKKLASFSATLPDGVKLRLIESPSE